MEEDIYNPEEWGTLLTNWLAAKKVNIPVQAGLSKVDELPDVPVVTDLAKNQEQMQIVRRNTYIFIHADMAWATYQWDFSATLATGKFYDARGQTTLVFTKVGNDWLVVHNHTAVDCGSLAPVEATPAPTVTPATPTQPKPQN